MLAVGEVEVRLHRGAVSHPAGVIAAWRGVRPVRCLASFGLSHLPRTIISDYEGQFPNSPHSTLILEGV